MRILPERLAAKIFSQIIDGLKCFHQLNIAHRDLKPDNIMVDLSVPHNPVTKIIDFGFAAQSSKQMQIFCGTPAYMSPEICAKKSYNGPASDMWAAGVILYTMLFGYQPFKAQTEKDLYKKIIKGTFIMPSTSMKQVDSKTTSTFSDSVIDTTYKRGPQMKSPHDLQANGALAKKVKSKNLDQQQAQIVKNSSTASTDSQEVFDNYPCI